MLLDLRSDPWRGPLPPAAPGVASWVTRGVFVGEKRAFFGPQVDDMFLGTVLYDHTTFRLGGNDLRNAANWQDQAQRRPRWR